MWQSWNIRKVEMRKIEGNSFRITGNTNFKKKLTSFVSKSAWGNLWNLFQSYESQS